MPGASSLSPFFVLPALQNNFETNADSVIGQFVPLTGMSNKDKVHRKKRLQGMATLVADLNTASSIATVSVH